MEIEEETQEKEEKTPGFSIKSFIGGVALGAVAAALATGICMYALHGGKSTAQTTDSGITADADADTDTGSLLTDAVKNKINLLETMISELYLDDVDTDAMAEGLYSGMIEALGDPYTVYYNEEDTETLNESIDGQYSGIGATLAQDADTQMLTIIKCFEDTPAQEAGLQPGDVIVKVDGTDVTGMDTSEAVALIKGEEGTEVELTIYREGETDYLTKTLTRRKIDIPTVAYEVLDDGIGYLQIASFDEVTTEQFTEAMDDLEAQGITGLVLDLRDNPGGRLDVVLDILERFVSDGLLVYTENKNGDRTEYSSESSADEVFGKPLAVLVNGNSASASEIFAGAVQDHGVGTIVGTTTYGKGVVQQLLDLGDDTMLKVTISKYFTPNGNDINHKGIEPDVEVELSEELQTQSVITIDEDNQLQTAIEQVKNAQ